MSNSAVHERVNVGQTGDCRPLGRDVRMFPDIVYKAYLARAHWSCRGGGFSEQFAAPVRLLAQKVSQDGVQATTADDLWNVGGDTRHVWMCALQQFRHSRLVIAKSAGDSSGVR